MQKNSRRMENSQRKNKKGFSLLELIVVIAIVGIIASVSWATLGGAKQTASAQNACEQVASMINKTRNYALSGKTVGGAVPGSFSITINGSNVSIFQTSETFSIPGGVSCGGPQTYTFSVPYGGCTDCSVDTTCTAGGGVSRKVKVTPNSAVCQ